jgi:HEAT repeat protein
MLATLLTSASAAATAQVAPLAPRWLAGTPPPPVETFAAGLERHNVPLTEAALIAALQDPDGEVRSLAAAQLAAMDDHAALKNIVRAF